ncbi:hypothetical protein [Streptomyces sp. NPDC001380]|uniref:hypothetical protein n=1 Tax=Streptomyces sp. NPDC001380 TaxID=3364566 RepID=UPI003696D3BE
MAETATTATTANPGTGLLAVYLNDHLTGSAAGVELARRMARVHAGTAVGPDLARLAAEIEEDQGALTDLMRALGVPVRRHRILLGLAGERAGRLKPNGRIVRRSPLSTVTELEAMRLGVLGKLQCWRVLRHRAERDPRVPAARLDTLQERAEQQAGLLEDLRLRAADRLLTAG